MYASVADLRAEGVTVAEASDARLGLLLDEFKAEETAVAAYHAGRGRVNSWLKDKNISPDGVNLRDIPIPETAHYVRKVMRAVNIYNSFYKSR